MQRPKTCSLIAGADRILSGNFVSSCDVLNCLFLLGVQNEIQLLSRLFCKFMAGLFVALFVDKCTACQSYWKSDFGWHRFQK